MRNKSGDDEIRPLDPGAELFRGQFGFRNRGNRTGVDPWDTYMEEARAEGLFYRALLTRRLRTRNPIALVVMALGVIVTLMPVEFSAAELVSGVPPAEMSLAFLFMDTGYLALRLAASIPLLIVTAFGVLLLVNLVLSLKDLASPAPDEAEDDDDEDEETSVES